ncbi:cytochrome P450 89A2-like [Coffea eugenioides]|uniref:cytochrome P450 89A2-like n=1 Tax=Coffea eugenioides TaxID=49369 RepID=UPI000F60C178|nr:cytochrome P450 89A2-like [Coffea eugenioides]
METYWFIIVVSLCISAILKSLLSLLSSSNNTQDKLPPGPYTIPVIGSFLWLRMSFADIEPVLQRLKAKYGPLISLRIGSRPSIFVASHSLAHRALVQNGAVFSDRPKSLPTAKIFNSNQHNISSARYGPTWRLLRRNLTSEILHPSRVQSYTRARRWVLGILFQRFLHQNHAADEPANMDRTVVGHFRYAMFCLLLLMCFGDKLTETKIQEVESLMRRALLSFGRYNILNFLPRLGKILFRSQWKELLKLREDQEKLLVPLIRARIEAKRQRRNDDDKEEEEEEVVAYVDTLAGLKLPDEKRELSEGEMVTLCSEFLNAGTDTTSTALQWIMANLVKYPAVQNKLYREIVEVVGPPPPLSLSLSSSSSSGDGLKETEEVKEEDLQKIPYLKAVVLEGLRRHPPGHFVLPHSVTEAVELEGYVVPKNATVNFMVAEMGWDPKVWESPMEFRPERFLEEKMAGDNSEGQLFDVTGSKEIKMMPFGAGRRVCPGSNLALLHLEYFVANLIWHFEWRAVDGDDVDLSEKQEFTVVMKNPLRANVSPRVKST